MHLLLHNFSIFRALCLFFLKKVKFWGLIFQSGPRNRQSTFWKTTPVKFEKIQLLPLCYRSLRPNWTASGDRTNSFYFIHWKGPGKVLLNQSRYDFFRLSILVSNEFKFKYILNPYLNWWNFSGMARIWQIEFSRIIYLFFYFWAFFVFVYNPWDRIHVFQAFKIFKNKRFWPFELCLCNVFPFFRV